MFDITFYNFDLFFNKVYFLKPYAPLILSWGTKTK